MTTAQTFHLAKVGHGHPIGQITCRLLMFGQAVGVSDCSQLAATVSFSQRLPVSSLSCCRDQAYEATVYHGTRYLFCIQLRKLYAIIEVVSGAL